MAAENRSTYCSNFNRAKHLKQWVDNQDKQWQNIMIRRHMNSIIFRHPEVTLLVLKGPLPKVFKGHSPDRVLSWARFLTGRWIVDFWNIGRWVQWHEVRWWPWLYIYEFPWLRKSSCTTDDLGYVWIWLSFWLGLWNAQWTFKFAMVRYAIIEDSNHLRWELWS